MHLHCATVTKLATFQSNRCGCVHCTVRLTVLVEFCEFRVAGFGAHLAVVCNAVARAFTRLWSPCAGCLFGPGPGPCLQGWGVHCAAPVPRGAALFTYAGERLSNREADARLQAYDADRIGHALLVSLSVCNTSICSLLLLCFEVSLSRQQLLVHRLSIPNRLPIEGQLIVD